MNSMTLPGVYIKPFYSISTNQPLGACWQAEDIDGNKAVIYLRTVVKCHNIYAWRFVMWSGETFKDGEATSIRKCWLKMFPYLRSNPKNGLIPDLERVANWYSGRMDK
jgi:hypothetical protein